MNNADKPAYPTNARMHSDAQGITKREYFAAMAIQGLMAVNDKGTFSEEEMAQVAARYAISVADELLKQLDS